MEVTVAISKNTAAMLGGWKRLEGNAEINVIAARTNLGKLVKHT